MMQIHKSIMWKYIAEEQRILSGILKSSAIDIILKRKRKKWKAIYFVAHGSSYNATVCAANFIGKHTGLRNYAFVPGYFNNNSSILAEAKREDVLVICISQTGTSSGLLSAALWAKSMGFFVLGITNDETSPLADTCEECLFMECGEEHSNAKTKGYSATLAILLLFALKYGCYVDFLSKDKSTKIMKELEVMTDKLDETTEKVKRWCSDNTFISKCKEMYFLGYSMNYGTAMEGQLKLMETMCIPTMFNEIQEFSHGMHRAINPESHIVFFNSRHPLSELTLSTYNYLLEKTPNLLLFNSNSQKYLHKNIVNLDEFIETESILLHTIAVQVLSAYLPEANGLDPNRFANDDFTKFVHTRINSSNSIHFNCNKESNYENSK